VAFAAYENVTLVVTMVPPVNITGASYQLNISNSDGTVALQSTTFTVIDLANGVFSFVLTSTQTGVTLGVGDRAYDIWRVDVGNEKRLVYGPMSVKAEQWK
jgi:hypothetical protein